MAVEPHRDDYRGRQCHRHPDMKEPEETLSPTFAADCMLGTLAKWLRILGYDEVSQLLGRPSHDTIHYLRPDGSRFPAAECPLLRLRLPRRPPFRRHRRPES